jgi:hypothetical protein
MVKAKITTPADLASALINLDIVTSAEHPMGNLMNALARTGPRRPAVWPWQNITSDNRPRLRA